MVLDYLHNLNDQVNANEISRPDLDNENKYNIDLAILIRLESPTINLDCLPRIIEMSNREITLTYNSLKHLSQLERNDLNYQNLEMRALFVNQIIILY